MGSRVNFGTLATVAITTDPLGGGSAAPLRTTAGILLFAGPDDNSCTYFADSSQSGNTVNCWVVDVSGAYTHYQLGTKTVGDVFEQIIPFGRNLYTVAMQSGLAGTVQVANHKLNNPTPFIFNQSNLVLNGFTDCPGLVTAGVTPRYAYSAAEQILMAGFINEYGGSSAVSYSQAYAVGQGFFTEIISGVVGPVVGGQDPLFLQNPLGALTNPFYSALASNGENLAFSTGGAKNGYFASQTNAIFPGVNAGCQESGGVTGASVTSFTNVEFNTGVTGVANPYIADTSVARVLAFTYQNGTSLELQGYDYSSLIAQVQLTVPAGFDQLYTAAVTGKYIFVVGDQVGSSRHAKGGIAVAAVPAGFFVPNPTVQVPFKVPCVNHARPISLAGLYKA